MKILWIPHTGWHIPQRAHLFCRELAERHEVHVTDWVADFVSVRDYLSWRYVRNFFYRKSQDGKITVHGIPRVSPALFSIQLRKTNRKILDFNIQRIIDHEGIDVVVGSFLASPPNAPRLVLDVCDDHPAYWREYRNNNAVAQEVFLSEAEWAEKCDHIVVVSSVLKDIFKSNTAASENIPISVIPNSIDLEKFSTANREIVRKKYHLGNKKVVGLISGLGEFSGLIRYIESIRLMNRPDIMHLIVGGGDLLNTAKALVRDYELENVIFTGWIDSGEVQNYFAALDVGVIPFDLSAFTHAAFPIKLLEYLAFNIPIVSTKLEEIERLKFERVHFADLDIESFSETILRAVDDMHADPGMRNSSQLKKVRSKWIQEYDLHELAKIYERILTG